MDLNHLCRQRKIMSTITSNENRDHWFEGQPWSLCKAPNYYGASSLEEISAERISEFEFRNMYTKKNRPCLIKGAAKHWSALQNWKNLVYLKEHTESSVTVSARTRTMPEFVSEASPSIKENLLEEHASLFQKMSFHDFLDLA